MSLKCLMLGSGTHPPQRKLKTVATQHIKDEEIDWTTLDMNPAVTPDIVFNLDDIEAGNRLPFQDETFDEIHAYDVMEHYGHQGHYLSFFRGWKELWRVLKPNGYVIGVVPLWSAKSAWADPGHTRVITDIVLSYLCKDWYTENLFMPDGSPNTNSPLTDYRKLVDPHWWKLEESTEDEKLGAYYFALRKMS